MKQLLKMIVILVISMVLISCYDNIELEDRAFAITLGIDKENDNFKTTIEIKNTENDSENLCYEGIDSTLTSAISKVDSSLNKHIYFGQTKLVVFGEELLKDKVMFKQALNSLEQNSNINKKIITIGTDGEAGKILKQQVKNGGLGILITNYFRNSQSYTHLKKSVETTTSDLRTSGSSLMPKISLDDTSIDISQAFIIKEYELVGQLTEEEINSYLMFNGLLKGAVMVVNHDKRNIPLEIKSNKSKVKFYNRDNKIICSTFIEIEANTESVPLENQNNMEKYMDYLQISAEILVKKDLEDLFIKFKKEYVVDEFALINDLRKYNYDIYKVYQNDIPNILNKIDFIVEPKVIVKNIGSVE